MPHKSKTVRFNWRAVPDTDGIFAETIAAAEQALVHLATVRKNNKTAPTSSAPAKPLPDVLVEPTTLAAVRRVKAGLLDRTDPRGHVVIALVDPTAEIGGYPRVQLPKDQQPLRLPIRTPAIKISASDTEIVVAALNALAARHDSRSLTEALTRTAKFLTANDSKLATAFPGIHHSTVGLRRAFAGAGAVLNRPVSNEESSLLARLSQPPRGRHIAPLSVEEHGSANQILDEAHLSACEAWDCSIATGIELGIGGGVASSAASSAAAS